MVTRTLILLKFLIFVCILANAKEYYVGINGNDSYTGTRQFPFASVFKASEMAMPGDTVTVLEGKYFLKKQFVPVRSGTGSQWITYRAEPGAKVSFDVSAIRKVTRNGKLEYFSRLTEGGFQIEGCSYLRFENIEVCNSYAANFIVRGPNCKKIELVGCKATQSFNSGIGLWYCDSVVVRNCEITKANENHDRYLIPGRAKRKEAAHEALSICGARYFDVYENHIHHCYKEGIDCKEVSQHGVIHHNLVHDMPRQAYYADAWFGLLQDVEFHSNVAYNCMWGFAISVEGKDSEIRNIRFHHNLIYNMEGAGVLFGMWNHNLMRSDIHIYNNTFYACGSPQVFSGGVGSIDILSKNFKDVYIYRNICDKGWDYEMGFTFSPDEVEDALEERNFVAEENLFESRKNRPSRMGQFDVMVYEYLPPNNQMGAPLYRNELKHDFVPEVLPEVSSTGRKWKYKPSPWFGAFRPLKILKNKSVTN
ncbi:right-handed parallel beta-helix repeat-containing protein [uncultured Draconibacterium sp.]|uniref:right-handed parallel beta-helix repeat-containing protein n=1 Tax=uncultured Draconibacterium sp. TaxID=1573823 RepID=UPI0029C7B98E|nr:right-handed parallel beta-helix repeat-containing protein [uncultured Draconibacterium sp.]